MPSRHMPTAFHHRAVVHGDTIYLSGMVADDKGLAVGGQLSQSLDKVDLLLGALGSSADNLLFVMIYLADMRDKEAMNIAWATYFQDRALPARATVGVAALGPGTLIEIVATAAA